jgi:hypothetical protein
MVVLWPSDSGLGGMRGDWHSNGFLPYALSVRGRRLVFGEGVYALAILAAILLAIFRGVTDRLIPLYAVGAFMAFTLSQAGMVVHWKRAAALAPTKVCSLMGWAQSPRRSP